MNTSPNTSYSGPEYSRNPWQDRDYFAWAKTPGFNPMKAVAVIAGFAIFPPIGVAALIYFIWNSRRSHAYAMGEGHRGHHHRCGRGHGRGRGRWTGNAAFDEHQAEVMQNLRAEREAFHAYREEQKRKRDQDAYEAFRSAAEPDVPKAD